MDQIISGLAGTDWAHWATVATAVTTGYVALNALQWLIPDLLEFMGLMIAWRFASAYIRLKRAEMKAITAITVKEKPVAYISRAQAWRARS